MLSSVTESGPTFLEVVMTKAVLGFLIEDPYHGLHEVEMPFDAKVVSVSHDPTKMGGLQLDALCSVNDTDKEEFDSTPKETKSFFIAVYNGQVEVDLDRFIGSIKIGPYTHFVFEAG